MATNTSKRTDEHRPSAIDPEAYTFVGILYQNVRDMIGGEMMLAEEREMIRKHMESTGGQYAKHEHGGSCQICGACAQYLAVFYHIDRNEYIRTGFDCAEKLHMGDARRFRAARESVRNALKVQAGKRKAQAILADAGLTRAWEIYTSGDAGEILHDMVRKLIRYGSLSEKQSSFLRKLVERHDNREKIEAQRAAEREAALPVPEGKQTVTVEVLKKEYRESNYGETLKMLVKHADGWLAWGTVPDSLQLFECDMTDHLGTYKGQRGIERGDKIEFTATFERSDRDEKFGFFKRPRKARVVSLVSEAVAA